MLEKIRIQNNRNPKLRNLFQDFEKEYIKKLLQDYQWHKTKVASVLGIDRKTLFRKIKTYGIQ